MYLARRIAYGKLDVASKAWPFWPPACASCTGLPKRKASASGSRSFLANDWLSRSAAPTGHRTSNQALKTAQAAPHLKLSGALEQKSACICAVTAQAKDPFFQVVPKLCHAMVWRCLVPFFPLRRTMGSFHSGPDRGLIGKIAGTVWKSLPSGSTQSSDGRGRPARDGPLLAQTRPEIVCKATPVLGMLSPSCTMINRNRTSKAHHALSCCPNAAATHLHSRLLCSTRPERWALEPSSTSR